MKSRKTTYWILWILCMVVLLLGVSIFSLCVGSGGIPVNKVIATIFESKKTTIHTIVFQIRLPRILLGIAIGGSLGLAGVILQGMFRNPLVEPYTLGISGGAAFAVCLAIVFRIKFAEYSVLPIFGFMGAISVVMFIYFLSVKRGILEIQRLLLAGVMISFISSSAIMLVMALCRIDDIHGIIFWTMGSLEEPNWGFIEISFLLSLGGLICSYLFALDLNALSLGEEDAVHLGVNVERTKRYLFIIASLLTGCSVAIAGIIGFVGLVVPHFLRMLVGNDHRILLVSSFLCGAIFLIFCDMLARILISPMELPVGVITGIVGGSLFLYAITQKRPFLWGH